MRPMGSSSRTLEAGPSLVARDDVASPEKAARPLGRLRHHSSCGLEK